MPVFHKRPLALQISTAVALAFSTSAWAEEPVQTLDTLVVVDEAASATTPDSYAARPSSMATRLTLSERETPQAMSTVTQAQLEDFRLTSVNDALRFANGVVVEQVETDRTYYSARGFDITQFQFDGIGTPFVYDNVQGDLDTAPYERIEVLRGANGLMSGLGQPSATINFIRKRPTTERQARVDLTGGSWDMRRVDTDVSGALSEDGGVRGRLVVAHENKNSYLDNYAREKNIVHAVVDAELTATTQLTVGHTYQTSDANAPLWGALPLAYTDGSLTHYHRNTSTATPWSFWDVQEDRTFAELSQTLGAGWSVKAVVTHLEKKGHGKLFYVYGTPDAVTEQGLAAFPSRYDDRTRQLIADLYAQGPFELAGRTHELVLGTSWSRSELDDVSHYGQGIGTPLPSLLEWTGAYPEPGFDAFVNGSDFTDRQTAYYAAARWSLLDPLTLLTGTRVVNAQSRGINYGKDRATNASGEVVPYAGLVYEITPSYSVYTSYTKIFDTQTETDANGDRLAPVTGETYEIGAKAGVLDERVNLGIALFRTRQDNVAEQTGMVGTQAIYRAAKGVVSEGFELDVNGELVSGLHLGAGYTYVDIQGPDGENPRAYAPQHLFRVATSYRVPVHPALKVGANVQWQDTIDRAVALTPSGTAVVKQDSYALLNLMASYDIATHWQAAINLNNVTNEKYLTSLQWDQSYYGAPRNASMTLSWKY